MSLKGGFHSLGFSSGEMLSSRACVSVCDHRCPSPGLLISVPSREWTEREHTSSLVKWHLLKVGFHFLVCFGQHTRWLWELLRDAKHSAALVFPRKTEGLVSVIVRAPPHPGLQESTAFWAGPLSCHATLLPASLGGLINMHLQTHPCSPAGINPHKLSLCRESVLQCLPRGQTHLLLQLKQFCLFSESKIPPIFQLDVLTLQISPSGKVFQSKSLSTVSRLKLVHLSFLICLHLQCSFWNCMRGRVSTISPPCATENTSPWETWLRNACRLR